MASRATIAFALLLCPLAAEASADVFLSSPIQSTVGSGMGTGSTYTSAPNDYPSAIPLNDFIMLAVDNAVGPLDFVLGGTNSAGITQYAVFLTVSNATSSSFTGVDFQFGTGTGSTFIPFAATGVANPGNPFFVASPSPSSPQFTTASLAAERLTYTGGTLGAGSLASFSFTLALPDMAVTPNSFTFRQTPLVASVPEPSPMMLATVAGLLGLSVAGWRRRRATA